MDTTEGDCVFTSQDLYLMEKVIDTEQIIAGVVSASQGKTGVIWRPVTEGANKLGQPPGDSAEF